MIAELTSWVILSTPKRYRGFSILAIRQFRSEFLDRGESERRFYWNTCNVILETYTPQLASYSKCRRVFNVISDGSGLLRKYEQQEKYDARDTIKGSRSNHTEEDGPSNVVSSEETRFNKAKPRNRTRRVNLRRACVNHCATIVAFLLFVAVCAALLVIIFCSDPTEDTVVGGNKRIIIGEIDLVPSLAC